MSQYFRLAWHAAASACADYKHFGPLSLRNFIKPPHLQGFICEKFWHDSADQEHGNGFRVDPKAAFTLRAV